jgi:hypothetical protein
MPNISGDIAQQLAYEFSYIKNEEDEQEEEKE